MKVLSLLESRMTFKGQGFGEPRDVLYEVVFNSIVCGYAKLPTDPSYAGQGVVMTYPMIRNCGICYKDMEADYPWVGAFIVHSVSGIAGNFHCDIDLDGYLKNNRIPGINGIDIHTLACCLRGSGTMCGMLCFDDQIDRDEVKHRIIVHVVSNGASQVSIRRPRGYDNGSARMVLLDYGTEENIICSLTRRGCTVRRFPNDAPFEEIKAWSPDGVMLSNDPGGPQACVKGITELKRVCQNGIPTFAICIGHQPTALSQSVNTHELKYGHRDINYPVKELETNRVYVTSQNHGYVVDAGTIDSSIAEISYVSMNDQSVEGLNYKNGHVFSVQFHPEACSGPLNTGFLFDRFMDLMEEGRV